MIIIPIPVSKEELESFTIDGMFPKWYWCWIGLFTIFSTVYLYASILYKEWLQETLQLISYGHINTWDLMFFPSIYCFVHVLFTVIQPEKWWSQLLVAILVQGISLSVYGSMLYHIHK